MTGEEQFELGHDPNVTAATIPTNNEKMQFITPDTAKYFVRLYEVQATVTVNGASETAILRVGFERHEAHDENNTRTLTYVRPLYSRNWHAHLVQHPDPDAQGHKRCFTVLLVGDQRNPA
jgi:hypothetical protein